MTLKTVQATAPSHWAPYFINGDSDGMTEAEEKAADQFAEWLGACPCDCEESGFLNWPDSRLQGFWPFAADCQTYTALINSEEVTQ